MKDFFSTVIFSACLWGSATANSSENNDIYPIHHIEIRDQNGKTYTTLAFITTVESPSSKHVQNHKEHYKTKFKVLEMDTLSAGALLHTEGNKPVILDFANEQRPGGAQENIIDSLFDDHGSSGRTILNTVAERIKQDKLDCKNKSDHLNNQKCPYAGWAFNDGAYIPINGAIYLPTLHYFKDDKTKQDHTPDASMGLIAAAAPNLSDARVRNLYESNGKRNLHYINTMKNKTRSILRLAQHKGHDSIVLGLWGCGIFANAPEEIAAIFKEVIDTEFKGVFQKIYFGVTGNPEGLLIFKKTFEQ